MRTGAVVERVVKMVLGPLGRLLGRRDFKLLPESLFLLFLLLLSLLRLLLIALQAVAGVVVAPVDDGVEAAEAAADLPHHQRIPKCALGAEGLSNAAVDVFGSETQSRERKEGSVAQSPYAP